MPPKATPKIMGAAIKRVPAAKAVSTAAAPSRSIKLLTDALKTISTLLSAQTPSLGKNKVFIDAIRVINTQLTTNKSDDKFTLTQTQCDIFAHLLQWFIVRCAPSINDLTDDFALSIINIIITAGQIPLADIVPIIAEKPDFEEDTQKINNIEELSQFSILSAVFGIREGFIPIYALKQSIITTILRILATKLNTQKTINLTATSQLMILSLLSFIHSIVGFLTYVKNKKPSPYIVLSDAEILSIIAQLNIIFSSYTKDSISWEVIAKSKTIARIILSIVTILTALMTFDTKENLPALINTEDGSQPLIRPEDDITLQRLHQSSAAIDAMCNIIFNTFTSIIHHKLQNAPHPLLVAVMLSPYEGPTAEHEDEASIYSQVCRQVFNQVHFLTVGYVAYNRMLAQRADEHPSTSPELNPYSTYITADLIKLIIAYLSHLDQMKQLSIENDEQNCIQRTMLVLAGSGFRHDCALLLQTGYFEFLIELVYDPVTNTLHKSAVKSNPTLRNNERQQQDSVYTKQMSVELSRIGFFALQLDCFMYFAQMGYSSRQLLITNYKILTVLEKLLSEKIISLDNIMRAQNLIVEKIALFLKNMVRSIDYYHEFDYSMFCTMIRGKDSSLSFDFVDLKQQTFQNLYASRADKYPTLQKLENDPEELAIFHTRISDDMYSVYLYELYNNYNYSLFMTTLLPSLCLYYKYPQVDISALNTPLIEQNSVVESTKNNEEKMGEKKAVINTALRAAQLMHKKNKDNDSDAKYTKELEDIFNKAVITGAVEQQMTNFNIVADLISFLHFLPSYHLFSYLPGHFASIQSAIGQDMITGRSLSPLQISLLNFFYSAKSAAKTTTSIDINAVTNEMILLSFSEIVKTSTKDILTGLLDNNDSNDDPAFKLLKNEKTKVEGDHYNINDKLDAITAQVIQYTFALLENKEHAKKHTNKTVSVTPEDSCVVLKFKHIREYATADEFLKEVIPTHEF